MIFNGLYKAYEGNWEPKAAPVKPILKIVKN